MPLGGPRSGHFPTAFTALQGGFAGATHPSADGGLPQRDPGNRLKAHKQGVEGGRLVALCALASRSGWTASPTRAPAPAHVLSGRTPTMQNKSPSPTGLHSPAWHHPWRLAHQKTGEDATRWDVWWAGGQPSAAAAEWGAPSSTKAWALTSMWREMPDPVTWNQKYSPTHAAMGLAWCRLGVGI